MDVDEPVLNDEGSPRPRKQIKISAVHDFPTNAASTSTPGSKRVRRGNNNANNVGTNQSVNTNSAILNGLNGVQDAHHAEMDLNNAMKQDTTISEPATEDLPALMAAPVDGEADAPASEASPGANTDAEKATINDEVSSRIEESANNHDFANLQQQEHNQQQLETRPTVLTPPPTVTDGCSVGVQSDKVCELGGPETDFLSLAPGSASIPASEHQSSHDGRKSPNANLLANVTHAIWNPRDPAVLASGGNSLCQIWTIPPRKAGESSADTDAPKTPPDSQHVKDEQMTNGTNSNIKASPTSRCINLFDLSEGDSVTSMTWSPDGEYLAVAITRSTSVFPSSQEGSGIFIVTKFGRYLHCLPGMYRWTLDLKYNQTGTLLSGINHVESGSVVFVWNLKTGNLHTSHPIPFALTSHVWTLDMAFAVCGSNIVAHGSLTPLGDEVALHPSPEATLSRNEWSKITIDYASQILALVAEDSSLFGLIDSRGDASIQHAHHATITDVTFQPSRDASPNSPRLLATSSVDGWTNIWDVNGSLRLVHTLSAGVAMVSSSFSPDGQLFASGNKDKIMIWNAADDWALHTVWTKEDNEAMTNSQNGAEHDVKMTNGNHELTNGHSQGVSPDYSLGWDSIGARLVWGAHDSVCFVLEWSK
ncbi:Transducin (beta)-like 1 X-linked receptor 1 [Agyrium rufum]|nr:Transducin (beta)-like 1 X-linked receptor 1 [Agyrium rufum]